MITNGNNVTIILDSAVIQSLTSVSLDTNIQLVDVTTRPTNGWKETIRGDRNGTLTFEGFYDAALADIDPGTLVQWVFSVDGGSYSGMGYVEDVSRSGGTDEAPIRTGTIKTTGPIVFEAQTEVVLCVLGRTLCVEQETLQARQ